MQRVVLFVVAIAVIVGIPAAAMSEQATAVLLTSALRFKGKQVSGWLTSEDVEQLLDEKVEIGSRDTGVTLTGNDGAGKVATLCREWLRLVDCGYYANTTYDMTMNG